MAIEAWYMDESKEDPRLPHHRNPKEIVSLDKLAEVGVLHWKLNAKNYENDEELKKIREARGYSYMDLLDLCPEKVENYEQKLKNFYTEHIHADEEIRYCLEGSGYFDVRDKEDRWIRIWMKEGDLIILPAGIYHRITLDTSNYVKLSVEPKQAAPTKPSPSPSFSSLPCFSQARPALRHQLEQLVLGQVREPAVPRGSSLPLLVRVVVCAVRWWRDCSRREFRKGRQN